MSAYNGYHDMPKKVMDMNWEQKNTQLQQKIIHLKSELDKYKTLLASLASQEEWERLYMEKDELQAKHDKLIEQCRHYEELLSDQKNEIQRLSKALKTMEEEKELLRQETEQFKTECAYWQEQAEANQKHIQSLEATVKGFQQKETERNEERKKTKEKNRLRKDGTLSFMNESIDSSASWPERMEKDYQVMKEQIDKIAKEFQKLQNALSNSTKTHEPEKDIDVLTKKIQEIEEKLSKMDLERQKDSLALQKHIFTQQMELELMMEKVTSFASEIKHLSNQIADLTKSRNDSPKESPNYDTNELKDRLFQLMQQFAASSDEKSKEPATSPIQSATPFSTSMQTGKAPSSPNSFLKLQEFIDGTNQPIVVSPVRKEAHVSHLYSQKSVPIKRARMENPSSRHRYPSQQPSPLAKDEDNRLNISGQNDYTASNPDKRSDASRLEQKKEHQLLTQTDEVRLESIHKASAPLKNQDERSEEIDQNLKIRGKHESPILLDDQEVLMQDQTTASDISANGQKSDSEAHEIATSASSVPVPIEENTITQTEVLLIEKEKPSKWGLWSLFKKTKLPQ
ncbi:Chromosome partition protein Smc [Geobacillus sp. TFV-3]|nr:Chromosome partition protein Smc [Geobacillus sp. TFV-3]